VPLFKNQFAAEYFAFIMPPPPPDRTIIMTTRGEQVHESFTAPQREKVTLSNSPPIQLAIPIERFSMALTKRAVYFLPGFVL